MGQLEMKAPASPSVGKINEFSWGLASIGIAFVTLWRTLDLASLRFDVPLIYANDPLSYMYTYDILRQPLMGAPATTGMPFGTTLYDAPNADGFNLVLIRALELLTGQLGTAFNSYIIATIVIVGGCAYAVGRRLGLTPLWACALSILFNLLPYHVQRIGHVFLLNYAPAAAAIWLALDVVSYPESDATGRRRPWPAIVIAAIFCGCSGIYYAFFSCFFLAVAASIAFLTTPTRAIALRSLLIVSVIAATSAANLFPSLLYRFQHGANLEVVERIPADSEVYGLKLSQMLLPIPGHRISALADLNAQYTEQSPLVNENKTAALGIVGGTGFLLLLATPFLARGGRALPDTVKRAAPLAWIGFLYATIGGLGSLFAWLISPQWRALNRISVFLGFIALFALFAVVQELISRMRSRAAPVFLAILIVGFGIFDTTPSNYAIASLYPSYRARFDSDKQFAEQLDNRLPAGSMLFQLPYVDYPEGDAHADLGGYDLLSPILQSKHLRWTFGAMTGRPEGRWYHIVAALDPEKLVMTLRTVGFSGIVINRLGYTDHGTSLEEALVQLGLKPEVISPNGTQAMYSLPDPVTPAEMALAVAPGEGWYPLELPKDGPVIWSRGDAEVVISNVASNRTKCNATFNLSTIVQRKVALVDGAAVLAKTVIQPGEIGRLDANIRVVAGQEKRLAIRTDAPASTPGNGDGRLLGFFWQIGSAFLCE